MFQQFSTTVNWRNYLHKLRIRRKFHLLKRLFPSAKIALQMTHSHRSNLVTHTAWTVPKFSGSTGPLYSKRVIANRQYSIYFSLRDEKVSRFVPIFTHLLSVSACFFKLGRTGILQPFSDWSENLAHKQHPAFLLLFGSHLGAGT